MCDRDVTPGFIHSLTAILQEEGEDVAVGALHKLGFALQPGGMPKNPSPETLLAKALEGSAADSDAFGWGLLFTNFTVFHVAGVESTQCPAVSPALGLVCGWCSLLPITGLLQGGADCALGLCAWYATTENGAFLCDSSCDAIALFYNLSVSMIDVSK